MFKNSNRWNQPTVIGNVLQVWKKYHSFIFMFCKIFFIYVVAWITEEIDELYNDKSIILYALKTVKISSQNLLNVELIYAFSIPF